MMQGGEATDDEATRWLDGAGAGAAPGGADGDPALGQVVAGRYRVESLLGEGGMGQVFRASQLEPVRRTVALKLLRGRRFDARQRAWFEIECQTLAQMQHPAIARIFDAGATADGVPFFAMEFIEGQPLTRACAEAGLDLVDRLALMARICDGVQHAHQKGIVHRDLKPANILVTRVDGVLQPRIIDFGIATAASRAGFGETGSGERAGTPDYMSPEQFAGAAMAIDTRSDVYSLGVVLYELIVGDRAGLSGVSQSSPRTGATTLQPPSARMRQAPGPVAGGRLRRPRLRELDAIVMKAVAHDRADRYESAGALAAELRRFLANRPLLAMPATRSYLAAKFVRRHRVGLAATVAVFVALVAGLAVSLYGLDQAQAQRRLAEERGLELEQVASFQRSMLRTIDVRAMGEGLLGLQREQLGRHPESASLLPDFERAAQALSAADLARAVIDQHVLARAEAALQRQFGNQPALAAELRYSLAQVRLELGLYGAAESDLRAVAAQREALAGSGDARAIKARADLASAIDRQGRADEARDVAQRSLEDGERFLPPGHPATESARLQLAQALMSQGEFAAARALQEQALGQLAVRADVDPASVLTARNNLGITLVRLGEWDAARVELEAVLAGRRASLGEEHDLTLSSLSNLGAVLGTLGDYEAALVLQREGYALRSRVSGAEHPSTLGELNNMASTMVQLDRVEEALPLMVQVVAARGRVLGAGHPQTLRSKQNLATSLARLDRLDEALALQGEVLAERRESLGADHPDTLQSLDSQASMLGRAGRHREAAALAAQVVGRRQAVLGAAHPSTRESLLNQSRNLRRDGRAAESVALLAPVLAGYDHADPAALSPVELHLAAELWRAQEEIGDAAAAAATRQRWIDPLVGLPEDALPAALRHTRGQLAEILAGRDD